MTNNTKVKNLLFDLGGVIMDIKRDNCVAALNALGFADADQYLGVYAQKGPFGQLESGEISADDFREFIREHTDRTLTNQQIDDAFVKFLIGIPVHRLRQLEQLHQHYGIYMLSNTNPIMWDSKIADEFCKDGHDMSYYFDGVVTSFEARCMKPAPGIFEYAIEHLGIDPTQTIFLDDSEVNLRGAEALSFQTAYVPEGAEFYEILQGRLS